jgi:hypothetical protein
LPVKGSTQKVSRVVHGATVVRHTTVPGALLAFMKKLVSRSCDELSGLTSK